MEEIPQLNPLTAEAEIKVIRSQLNVMGANNSEFSELDRIVSELKAGVLKPTEALRQAILIRDSKGPTSN